MLRSPAHAHHITNPCLTNDPAEIRPDDDVSATISSSSILYQLEDKCEQKSNAKALLAHKECIIHGVCSEYGTDLFVKSVVSHQVDVFYDIVVCHCYVSPSQLQLLHLNTQQQDTSCKDTAKQQRSSSQLFTHVLNS